MSASSILSLFPSRAGSFTPPATSADRVLLVGAGPVGLPLAKELREAGVAFDHIEASDGVGGNWRHGVYPHARLISSKRTTEYPDFPMKPGTSTFPTQAEMLEYFEAYATHYSLRSSIEFGTKLLSATPREGDVSGASGWNVQLQKGTSEGPIQRSYRAVVLSIGHHWDRRWPQWARPNEAGQVPSYLHSKDYRSPEVFRGKRVLVVGGGNSGVDLLCDALSVGAEVSWSLREGHWFLPRSIFGIPTVEWMRPWLPVPLQRVFFEEIARRSGFLKAGLPAPSDRVFDRHPTIGNDVVRFVREGRIRVHGEVDRIDGNTAVFLNGDRSEVDVVACATGFHVSFPCLPEGLVEVVDAVPQLQAGLVLKDTRGLFIVGSLQPRSGFGPIVGPGAKLVAALVKAEPELHLPLGRIFAALGRAPAKRATQDPNAAKRTIAAGRALVPWLPVVDRALAARERRSVRRTH